VWQASRLWHWAGSGGALGSRFSPRLFVWRVWHLEASTFCVASVALGDIDLHFVAGVAILALGWLLWRAWFPLSPRLFVAFGRIDLHSVW